MSALYNTLYDRDIRLFKLHHHVDKRQPLTGELFTTRLNSEVEYNALSYVWGTKNEGSAVSISGVDIKISDNLDRALRQIREFNGDLPIWVDQICINSDDVAEKAEQVKLMGQIYAGAQEVLVILCAHNILEENSVLKQSLVFSKMEELYQLPLETHRPQTCCAVESLKQLRDVHTPFRCNWWRRMWTAQELLFARRLRFFSHGNNVTNDPLEHFCKWYLLHPATCCHSVDEGLVGMLNREVADLISTVVELFAMRESYQKSGVPLDLLSTLVKTRDRDASNPLDKIYALASLTKIPLGMIDYRQDPSDCYAMFAKHIIDSSGRLDIFRCVDGTLSMEYPKRFDKSPSMQNDQIFEVETLGLKGLPSWVPDWSISRRTFAKARVKFHHQALDHYSASLDKKARLKACGNGEIILRGIDCSSIIRTSPTFAELDPNLSAVIAVWATLYGPETVSGWSGPSNSISTEHQYRDAAFDILSRHGDLLSVTAMPLYRYNSKRNDTNSDGIPREDPRAKLLYKMAYRRLASETKQDEMAIELLRMVETTDAENEDDKILKLSDTVVAVLHLLKRHLLQTSDGAIGFASTQAQPGDLVCVLYGGNTPFILREVVREQDESESSVGNLQAAPIVDDPELAKKAPLRRFRIIGEAYVRGLMLGEAIERVRSGTLIEEDFLLI